MATGLTAEGSPALDAARFRETARITSPNEAVNRHLSAIGPDGSVLVGETGMDIENPDEGKLWLEVGGRRLPIRTPPHRGVEQEAGFAIDEDWVVWIATTSFDLATQPWSLYAFNRRTHQSSTLAHSAKIGGHDPPAVPGYTGPTISKGRVFWAQAGGTPGKERSEIFGCVITRCVPRRLLVDAAFPSATGNDLYAIQLRGVREHHKKLTTMSVVRLDISTGRRIATTKVPLRDHQMPTGFAANDTHAIWTLDQNHVGDEAVIYEFATKLKVTVDAGTPGRGASYPVIGDGFAAWAEGSGSSPENVGGYVYDFESGKVASIGNVSGLYGVEAAGPYFAWQEAPSRADGNNPTRVVDRVVRMN